MKILIITTSHAQLGNTGRRTGVWLEEIAIPYYIFKEAGAAITLASPMGGDIPLDPKSESIMASTPTIRRFQKDAEAIAWLSRSVPLDTMRAEDFDTVFVAGGHGAMWDFRDNEVMKQLLGNFNRQHKVIGLVCHGVAALLSLENDAGGPFVKGKRVTAFSNSEEQVVGLTAVVPFSLESALTEAGALYSKGTDYTNYTVTDGNIVCGQNPISSQDVSRKMLLLMKDYRKVAL